MWNGKTKAITFSFDDGVTQDLRTIEILNKYGLKCTFNLNSATLGTQGVGSDNSLRNKVDPFLVKDIYAGHEVAVHTLMHPLLTQISKNGIIWQVEKDREILSELCGYEVIGMAYPCGGQNNDDRVAKIIKENTGVKYARTIDNNYKFDLQENLYRFNPTVPANNLKSLEIAKQFLELKTDKPQLLYLWGHTYEFDHGEMSWGLFEQLCEMISKHDDVFYATNKDVFFE